jgi:hypothetical protein
LRAKVVRGGRARWHFLRDLLIADLLVGALYAPWLPVFIEQALPANAISSAAIAPAAAGLLERLWRALDNPFPFKGLPWIDIRLLPLMLFGAWRLRASSSMAVLVAFILGGVGVMFLASQFHPLLDGKTLAWAGLCAILAAAIGCSAAGRFGLPLLVFATLLELRADFVALDPAPEGWREVAQILRETTARPGDAVYINYAGATLPLRHYGWPEEEVQITVFAKDDEEPWLRGRPWPIVDPREVAGQAIRLNRVWLLVYGEAHQSDAIAKEIEASSARVLHRRTEKLDLSLFASNST